MTKEILTVAIAGLTCAAGLFATSKPVTVELKDAKGESVGSATLSEKAGSGVTIKLNVKNLPPGEHAAHITAVSPEIVGNQITARAVPDEQWPAGLRQNQRVSARLVFESKKNVLKLPRGAFVEASGGRSAYVVDGGMATRRPIVLGSVGASEVEIVSGLREGDRVILSDTSPFNNVNSLILR